MKQDTSRSSDGQLCADFPVDRISYPSLGLREAGRTPTETFDLAESQITNHDSDSDSDSDSDRRSTIVLSSKDPKT